MPLMKFLLATALATVIGTAGATAQDAEHHPGTAAEATAPAAPAVTKPTQETVPDAAACGSPDRSRIGGARAGDSE